MKDNNDIFSALLNANAKKEEKKVVVTIDDVQPNPSNVETSKDNSNTVKNASNESKISDKKDSDLSDTNSIKKEVNTQENRLTNNKKPDIAKTEINKELKPEKTDVKKDLGVTASKDNPSTSKITSKDSFAKEAPRANLNNGASTNNDNVKLKETLDREDIDTNNTNQPTVNTQNANTGEEVHEAPHKIDYEQYNNQRLSDSRKSSFARSKSKAELEQYARERLKEIAYADNIYAGAADIIPQSIYGYRAFFLGSGSGTKNDFIDDFTKLLYDIGKVADPIPERINFVEIPEEFTADRVYVINNIADAVITLFGSDDFSGEASMDQVRYRKKLESLIRSPGSAYIILDAEETDIRGFKTLDARIGYIFSKVVNFPNLSNEDILNFYIEFLPKDFGHFDKIDDKWKQYFIEYLQRNRRYFPFDNKELSIYLANYSAGEGELVLPPEKYDATTLEESFAHIIGLDLVKNQIRELQEYLITRQKLESFGVKLPDFNLHMLLIGSPGTGKFIDKEAKVLYKSSNGFCWKSIGKLKVGDTVMGGTGKPCKVLGVFPQPVKDFYEITFSDGIKQGCCGEHLWRVQDRYGRRNTIRDKKANKQVPKEQRYMVFETQEMYKDFRIVTKGENRAKYSIDYVTPLEFPEKNLPIDPYALGALLGDGIITDKSLHITSIDLDLVKKVEEGLKKDFKDCEVNHLNDGKSHNINKSNELKKALKDLGILNTYSNTKFIPEEYLFAGLEQRWELLRGLLDTDGSADKRGGYIEYVSVSEQLIKDVQQLVLSLGGQARLSTKEEPFYTDENGEKVICQKAYRLIIMFCKEDADKAFYLERKKAIYKPKRLRKNIKRYIEDIKPIAPQKGVCIAVDDPTHTYVIQNYIITHNTTMARIIAKVLFDIGYIREDKLIEVTSKDLVAPTGGMTGAKTNKVIMNAMGGVLFIDEAYSLAISSGTPGLEAIANLVKAMEDYKGEFVCLFAGYALEMQEFLRSNSGIASRIAYTFEFKDYTQEELFEIFRVKLTSTGMKLSPDAIEPLVKICKFAAGRRNFGNGRFVDKLLQKSLTKHATLEHKDQDSLMTLTKEAVPEVNEVMASFGRFSG